MYPLFITKLSTLVLATILVLVSTAPQTTPPVTLGFYSSYTDLSCDMANGSKEITVGQCQELSARAESVEAKYDNAEGTEFRLYTDASCTDFVQVAALNTCVSAEDYSSISLSCIGGVECAAP